MAFGPRRAPQHPELAAWLGKTRLPSGGAGVVAKGRKEGRKEEWHDKIKTQDTLTWQVGNNPVGKRESLGSFLEKSHI